MQIPSLINRGRNGFNMTPMIDVVFLLIIFFLVASHLSDQESQVEMELPTAQSAVAPEAISSRITLNVPASGQFLFNGSPVSLESFEALIQQGIASHGTDLEVRIRTDNRVVYSSISPLLKSCAKAGIWNVTFAVYSKESKQ